MRGLIKNQSGNVIWLILFVVAVLGILTTVISRNSSSVDQAGSREKAAIAAADMLRYAKSIEQAIEQMRLAGISENEISFENSTTALNYTNANCDDASDPRYPDCQIFDRDGGALTYKTPPSNWLDKTMTGETAWQELVFSGRSCVPGVGPTRDTASCWSDGIDNEDLTLFIPYVKKEVCLEINRKMGIAEVSGEPPTDSGCAWALGAYLYMGSFQNNLGVNSTGAGDSSDAHYQKPTGCYRALIANCNWLKDSYHFYHVVLPR